MLNSAAPIDRACGHTSTYPQNISTHLNAKNNPGPKNLKLRLKKESLIFKSSCFESIAHSFQLFKDTFLLYSITISTFRRCAEKVWEAYYIAFFFLKKTQILGLILIETQIPFLNILNSSCQHSYPKWMLSMRVKVSKHSISLVIVHVLP